jgi:subfamily B ATP-binding cassette protein MsbA
MVAAVVCLMILAAGLLVLIFDEATSSLDSQSEKLIQQAIEPVMRDRTTIVVAHRLSTVKNADNILVLRQGKLVESGQHEELLARRGVYRMLADEMAREPVTHAHAHGTD